MWVIVLRGDCAVCVIVRCSVPPPVWDYSTHTKHHGPSEPSEKHQLACRSFGLLVWMYGVGQRETES